MLSRTEESLYKKLRIIVFTEEEKNAVRERLHLMCGGTLEIQSSKESGTLVTIIIPASPNQSSPAVR